MYAPRLPPSHPSLGSCHDIEVFTGERRQELQCGRLHRSLVSDPLVTKTDNICPPIIRPVHLQVQDARHLIPRQAPESVWQRYGFRSLGLMFFQLPQA